jgi:IS605 OrfB family transposase
MATLTKTLKLPFLRLNEAKTREFARLERLNTDIANQILAIPKDERRTLTTKSFAHIELGSGWVNQTIRNANARTKVKHFRRLPLETSNQNWTLHRVGDTFSVAFGLLRGIKKRIPIEVHVASHRDLLEAMLNGSAKPGSIKLFQSRRGIWYVLISVSMEVPDAEIRDRWIGVDRGQNIPMVAATPDGPVVFWKAKQIRHVRRVFAKRRQTLQSKGKHRAVKKLEHKEHRIVTHLNHVMSKQLVALSLRCGAGIRFEDLSGVRTYAKQRKVAKSDADQNLDYWPFYQLETFARYKAMAAGVAVDAVCPHYTTQTCCRCGALNNRRKHAYVCTRCGHKAHADANAAINIRDWYGLCCPLVLDAPAGGLHEPAPNWVREMAAQAAT